MKKINFFMAKLKEMAAQLPEMVIEQVASDLERVAVNSIGIHSGGP